MSINMKMRIVVTLILCFAGTGLGAQERDSLLVMFWNVENFFDWTDQGTGESDREYSSYGSMRWTKKRFYAKCELVSKSVMWIEDCYGRVPDVIGLAEVENSGVLSKLLSSTLLRKYDYCIIHRDSDDRRGIDVALLYRKSVMSPVSVIVKSPPDHATRDILCVEMLCHDGTSLDFIVNHHPSKYGGEKNTQHKRMAVMGLLKDLCDSLCRSGHCRLVAMGDFNDTPDADQFRMTGPFLENMGIPLHERGEGTIRYKGKWELIDNFLVSPGVCMSEMIVGKIPFIMTYDRRYPGEKPLRTYTGPRYMGGVSDHCPIVIWIGGVLFE